MEDREWLGGSATRLTCLSKLERRFKAPNDDREGWGRAGIEHGVTSRPRAGGARGRHLVPLHRGFDDLIGAWPQSRQGGWVDEQFYAAGDARLASCSLGAFLVED